MHFPVFCCFPPFAVCVSQSIQATPAAIASWGFKPQGLRQHGFSVKVVQAGGCGLQFRSTSVRGEPGNSFPHEQERPAEWATTEISRTTWRLQSSSLLVSLVGSTKCLRTQRFVVCSQGSGPGRPHSLRSRCNGSPQACGQRISAAGYPFFLRGAAPGWPWAPCI